MRITPQHLRKRADKFASLLVNLTLDCWEEREEQITKAKARISAKSKQQNDKRFIDGLQMAWVILEEEIPE